MDHKSKRQTIYSPMQRANNKHQDDQQQDDSQTLAKLRYLDESDEDEATQSRPKTNNQHPRSKDLNSNSNFDLNSYRNKTSQEVHFEKCLNRSPTFQRDKELEEYLQENDLNRELVPEDLEEVYLCSCCGVTRQLDPAMKHMPLFQSLFALFNFLVLVFGAANLAMGLWFRIDPKVYEIHKHIETQNFTLAGWIMLAGGALACLVALSGFGSSSKQSLCRLIFYCITMTLLTILFIGTLVLLTVYGLGAPLERFMNKEVYEQIRRRTMSTELDLLTSGDAAQFLDFIQVKLRCCGAQDFRDYQKLGMIIPTTCYTIAGNYINAPGCGQALRELFDLRAGLAAGFTAGSVVAQICSVLLASLMVCSIYNWRAEPRPASAASYVRRSPTPAPGNIRAFEDDDSPTLGTHKTASGLNSGLSYNSNRPLSRASSIEV